jgi:hypothetical protein
MKLLIGWFAAVASVALVESSFAAGGVHVRGHVRKDGTFVQPHYRSAPDGAFYNNWSTNGNVNLYTGEDGKVVTPPLRNRAGRYTPPAATSYTPRLTTPSHTTPSIPAVPHTPSLGASPLPSDSPSDLVSHYDREAREQAARRLQDKGIDVDWQKHPFMQLIEMERQTRRTR